jgi:hypothetical protein
MYNNDAQQKGRLAACQDERASQQDTFVRNKDVDARPAPSGWSSIAAIAASIAAMPMAPPPGEAAEGVWAPHYRVAAQETEARGRSERGGAVFRLDDLVGAQQRLWSAVRC